MDLLLQAVQASHAAAQAGASGTHGLGTPSSAAPVATAQRGLQRPAGCEGGEVGAEAAGLLPQFHSPNGKPCRRTGISTRAAHGGPDSAAIGHAPQTFSCAPEATEAAGKTHTSGQVMAVREHGGYNQHEGLGGAAVARGNGGTGGQRPPAPCVRLGLGVTGGAPRVRAVSTSATIAGRPGCRGNAGRHTGPPCARGQPLASSGKQRGSRRVSRCGVVSPSQSGTQSPADVALGFAYAKQDCIGLSVPRNGDIAARLARQHNPLWPCHSGFHQLRFGFGRLCVHTCLCQCSRAGGWPATGAVQCRHLPGIRCAMERLAATEVHSLCWRWASSQGYCSTLLRYMRTGVDPVADVTAGFGASVGAGRRGGWLRGWAVASWAREGSPGEGVPEMRALRANCLMAAAAPGRQHRHACRHCRRR